MPYNSIDELPDSVKSRYSPRCQEVFRKTFNNAMSPDHGGGPASEEAAFKMAHTAAGMCKDAGKAAAAQGKFMSAPGSSAREAANFVAQMNTMAGKAEAEPQPMKAAPLDDDEMSAWFDGRIPRRLLAIPFGGPIGREIDGKGRDMDMEYFDERTDIKPDWFDRRPADWHHSQDPSGLLNGVLIGYTDRLGTEKGKLGEPDEYGWWVDMWFKAGERRIAAVRALQQKGAELFGSSYAYPNLVKRGKAGHIDVWPYMMQTLSTSPQNTNSIHRPAKAALDLFDQADITVLPALRDVLTEIAELSDLPTTFPMGSESAAKAGRELSGANLAKIERFLAALDELLPDFREMAERVRNKYKKPEDVSSN